MITLRGLKVKPRSARKASGAMAPSPSGDHPVAGLQFPFDLKRPRAAPAGHLLLVPPQVATDSLKVVIEALGKQLIVPHA